MSEGFLRVLTYNVHGQRDDRAALAEVVRGVAADVVIVQEGPRRFGWRNKTANLARSFGAVLAVGGLPSLGNLILTDMRVHVHRTWTTRFPLTPGRHLRGAAFAECSVGRRRFLVAGSHLSLDANERPGQAELLKKAVTGVELPAVIGADVNETSGGAGWRTLADGMTDAAVHTDAADRCTFPCREPQHRIDALFVDPRIEVTRYDVVDTPLTRRASDHFPVVADLIVPE
ncbi:endonuclease/exonuclease/phosphatase family protein [Catenuloplanes sp. NPDC051500]|uniref:endonuclease/exonuclease/phosphatase family protein n=1 Tax=Catenuloplanes sp. NPDC051500 TaxID=3363959 RepID=UPI0037BA305A